MYNITGLVHITLLLQMVKVELILITTIVYYTTIDIILVDL